MIRDANVGMGRGRMFLFRMLVMLSAVTQPDEPAKLKSFPHLIDNVPICLCAFYNNRRLIHSPGYPGYLGFIKKRDWLLVSVVDQCCPEYLLRIKVYYESCKARVLSVVPVYQMDILSD